MSFLPAIISPKLLLAAGGIAFAAGSFSGWFVRDAFCDAATFREQVRQQKLELAARDMLIERKQGEVDLANRIAAADRVRALAAEERLRQNQENVDATPHNPAACIDRDGARRVRSVR